MSGYLQLNNKQNFQGEYFSVEENEPLREFGKISDINILIGANNSRKSRFMRELVKTTIVQTIVKVAERLRAVATDLQGIGDQFSKYSTEGIVSLEIKLPADAPQPRGNEQKWIKLIKIFKVAGSKRIHIDGDYFNSLVQTINTFSSDFSQNNFYAFRNSIEESTALFDFLTEYDQHMLNMKGIGEFAKLEHYLGTKGYENFQTRLREVKVELQNLLIIPFDFQQPHKIYIPTLRTAVNLYGVNGSKTSKVTHDVYAATINKHYSLYTDRQNKINVFTGFELYGRIKKDRNSSKEIRKRFAEFEEFMSKNFFQGKVFEAVALDVDEQENQHIQLYIGGENERELHDLGDGVQALIILLYPIFMAEAGTWLFIEEPELNMHPGLQHLFIKTLLTHPAIREKNLRFFMTSHSNHLLNFSLSHADAISVFSFEKQTTGTELRSNIRQVIGHDVEILNMLGVYNASVYMANCSLWVEGVSDRRYLSAFLYAYMRDQQKEKFHEDLHFGFFEYAGSNVSHYLFDTTVKADSDEFKRIKAHFLANRIFLLVDKDAGLSKQKKQQQLQDVNAKSDKFEFATTEVIEVENLLSAPVLKLLLKDLLTVDGGIVDSLTFKERDYRDTRLGSYLKGLLPKQNLPAIEDKSGTLTTPYKIKFSAFVLERVENGTITWDMIAKNAAAKKLTEKLYEFIYRHNHP